MASFRIGDRVEIIGEPSGQVHSRIGVVTGIPGALCGQNFTIQLADGAESSFLESQLNIPPAIFADIIFDTDVSPVPSGLRGLTVGRYMRFIAGEFDIYLKFAKSEGQNGLLGQLTSNNAYPETFLVTLLCGGQPYARTPTDALGEFKLRDVPCGNAALEILGPSRRILATFDVPSDVSSA